MSSSKALIVSPKIDECQYVADLLKQKNVETLIFHEKEEAMAHIAKDSFALILCDSKTFLDKAKKLSPKSLRLHIKAFKLEEAIKKLELMREAEERVIAESPLMQELLKKAEKIAKSQAHVFISGESGTGKEVIAKFIHDHSPRKTSAFIKVNCAAVPETLIESEFFGHERGAFTGAHSRRLGRFELADMGTLLLDEISEVPLSLQSKLLRVVQEREFERLGGMKPLTVDVRLISTSNRNMKEAIEQGLFREDLYYRLNVVPLHLPPLRDRKEDILPLAQYFLIRACLKNGQDRKSLSNEVQKKLLKYNFPGNIRELANIIEQAVVLTDGELIEEIAIVEKKTLPSLPENLTLAQLEKWYILKTLKLQKGNRTKTAAALDINVRTLRNKLKSYEID